MATRTSMCQGPTFGLGEDENVQHVGLGGELVGSTHSDLL